ncbi:MAG: hypothetical protein DRH24_01030 [Deltaproteobacteria bacterium]|nr:MAG: hypothetical protein DRH24_01030 [Deltaproteobacteria bacterium]
MEEFLDIIWLKVLLLIQCLVKCLDYILAPLNHFGPGVVILAVVFVTVAATKYFSKIYKTKRYVELEKKFKYWFNLRKEALMCEDPEKGKELAKNIDQAKLNRVYYDYFFEGLLSSLLTKYLPILIMLAYVNEAFKPDKLLKNFGRGYIFKFVNYNGEAILVGAIFWFVLSMLLVYLIWFITEKLYFKHMKTKKQPD